MLTHGFRVSKAKLFVFVVMIVYEMFKPTETTPLFSTLFSIAAKSIYSSNALGFVLTSTDKEMTC